MTKEEERLKALVEGLRHNEIIAALNKLNSTLEQLLELLKPKDAD